MPLSYSARMLTWGHWTLQAAIGGVTVALGMLVIYETGVAGLLGSP